MNKLKYIKWFIEVVNQEYGGNIAQFNLEQIQEGF